MQEQDALLTVVAMLLSTVGVARVPGAFVAAAAAANYTNTFDFYGQSLLIITFLHSCQGLCGHASSPLTHHILGFVKHQTPALPSATACLALTAFGPNPYGHGTAEISAQLLFVVMASGPLANRSMS